MYQLMSAAVHVLRYVLSSGYQMRALHEFTNVSGSSADLDASDRNYSVLYMYDVQLYDTIRAAAAATP